MKRNTSKGTGVRPKTRERAVADRGVVLALGLALLDGDRDVVTDAQAALRQLAVRQGAVNAREVLLTACAAG